MKLIQELQKKPQSTKNLIIWIASIFIMIIIIAIWLSSFSRNISLEKEVEKTEIPSLFENIKKDFSALKENILASLKNYGEQEETRKTE
ncbi:hypothetical protein KJ684_01090 [Patescibacteria group bacterium]|nr:hypothetical protein [Patescibacteria group bacterium]